jgi:hypothetical protein
MLRAASNAAAGKIVRPTRRIAGLELEMQPSAGTDPVAVPRYQVAPGWTLEAAGGRLLVHGGADHLFAIDDVAPGVATEVCALWEGAPAGPEPVSDRAAEVLDQLVMVGALRPAVGRPGAPLTAGVHFVGRPVDLLAPALAGALEAPAPPSASVSGCGVELVPADSAALVVYVRTSGTLAEAARAAASGPCVPHLLADVAYHHTVSLGPLVVPGDTACLTCLSGRVGAAWGDATPPEEPLAARNVALLTGLLANELTKVAAGDRGLANRTVALDLAGLRLVEGTVLRHPWCPACGQPAGPGGPGGGLIPFPGRAV